MRKMLSIALALLLLNVAVTYGQQMNIISIEDVHVIPMTGDTILRNQRVLVSGGRILKIEPASSPSTSRVSQTIDGKGKYLVPGLSEMHYHGRGNESRNDFRLLVANGITTVRNMAEMQGQDQLEIRRKSRAEGIIAPNFFTTGPYLRHQDLQTVADVVKVVRMHREKGYDFLKIADNLPREIYLELIRQSQLNGVRVIGHAQRQLPLEYSMRMRSIEHIEEFVYLYEDNETNKCIDFSDARLAELAKKLKDGGLYIGTTLAVYDFITRCLDDEKFSLLQKDELAKYLAPGERENFLTEKNDYRKLKGRTFDGKESTVFFNDYFRWMKKFACILAENGVYLLSGSDTYGMVIIGFSLHNEFALLQDAGLKPYDILLASTAHAARYLDTYATEGTISEGKNANMVLLGKNPLQDIRNTRTIEGVMLKGKWIDKNAINAMLKEVETAYR